MTTEIAVYPEKLRTSEPLSLEDIRKNTKIINQLLTDVLKEGEDGVGDYGLIKGCGNKPGLFKPGAEKIMLMFKLGCFPEVIDYSTADCVKFIVRTRIVHLPTGVELGIGLGSCSSDEDKYKWRKAKSEDEFNATPEERRREKYFSNYTEKQIRTNPADLNNTILKMACKRSKVDGVITCTAASDIFTQDLEEEAGENGGEKKPVQKPKAKISALKKEDFRFYDQSKFKAACKGCGKDMPAGSPVYWSKALGTYCGPCLEAPKEEKPSPAPANVVTPKMLETLEKLAAAAGLKLADRIGRDGLESTDQIEPKYYQELSKEFARIIDAK